MSVNMSRLLAGGRVGSSTSLREYNPDLCGKSYQKTEDNQSPGIRRTSHERSRRNSGLEEFLTVSPGSSEYLHQPGGSREKDYLLFN